MYLTQEQIDVLKDNLRHQYIKLELLNDNLKIVDSLEGYATGGSLNENVDNDVRRNGTVEMLIPINQQASTLLDQLNGYTINYGGKVWLDKKIKISVGIMNNHTQQVVWYKLGVYLIDQPVRTFNATSFTLSFQCVDLMAKLTGTRQGQLTGLTTTFEKGHYEDVINTTTQETETVYVRTKWIDVFTSVLTELGGISKYSIYPIPEIYQYLPYDMSFGVGSTVYDMLKQLMDVLTTWEMFFDVDGVFVVRPIPSGSHGMIYKLEEDQYLSDTMATNFQNVKNQVVVYGRLNTLTYFTENTEESPNNVVYDNDNNTLELRYDYINVNNLVISATTFGFVSRNEYNSQPFTKVKIYNGDDLVFTTTPNLVKFEGVTSSFGKVYSTNQVEANTIVPYDIYFIRILDASITKNADDIEIIDITKPVTFEFMGKQQTSYCEVDSNKESAFYINNGIEKENYYAGTAFTSDGSRVGDNYLLKLNNENSVYNLTNGAIITFIANATNTHIANLGYTSISVQLANGTTIKNGIPLVKNIWVDNSRPYLEENKLSNDYTIWEIQYEVYNNIERFVLLGRAKNAYTLVLSGGEYDNIYSDQLAYERTLSELFTHSTLNDTITISCVPNYAISGNCKFFYNPNNALPINIYDTQEFNVLKQTGGSDFVPFVAIDGKTYYVKANNYQSFIIKTITYPLGVSSTGQSITAVRVYDSGNLLGEN